MSIDPAQVQDEFVESLIAAAEADDTDPVQDSEGEPSEPERKPYKSQFARRQEKMAKITPIHEASKKRGRGRPRKVDSAPTEEALEYNRRVMEEQARFVDSDEIVQAARDNRGTVGTLQLLKERIAASAAALEFHRMELQKRGISNQAIPQIISRQIAAMREIANVELEIRKLGVDAIDLKNERLQSVFALLIETFRDVASEVLSPEQFDLVWNKLETSLEGWEDRADNMLR